jgi:hypothetical protein
LSNIEKPDCLTTMLQHIQCLPKVVLMARGVILAGDN